jgi:hypothetical protein
MYTDREESIRALYGVSELNDEFMSTTSNLLFAQTSFEKR